jgi:peptide deformylase
MKITNKNLYRAPKPVDEAHWKEVIRDAFKMIDFMHKNNGIGLAANQVGIGRSFFVMDCKGGSPTRIVINPKIIEYIGEPVRDVEGCLSFGDQLCLVDRPPIVCVQYNDVDGSLIEDELRGLEARCFQHEYDHLQGTVMFERDYRRVK